MSLLTLPRAQIPLADERGFVTREWYRYFSDATARMGGVDGSGSDDLTLSQFEDAGIEESKQAIYRLADEIGQQPPSIPQQIEDLTTVLGELQAQIAVLSQAVQDLQIRGSA